jgi:hypothetical protein
VRLGAYVYPKYINVSYTESNIVKKSVDRDCKSNSVEREEKPWDPNVSLGVGK